MFERADSLPHLGLAGIATVGCSIGLNIMRHISDMEDKMVKIKQFTKSISFWNACLSAIGLMIVALLVLIFSMAGQVSVH